MRAELARIDIADAEAMGCNGRRIRDLENETGAALFVRHHSRVRLTYAGRRFVSRARKAGNQIGIAKKDAGAIGRGENGVVWIGIFFSLAPGFLVELPSACQVPRLEVIDGGPAEHLSAIQQHRTEVAFLTGRRRLRGATTEDAD
jgi:DNA-binding transcriptional LysR family regulator